MTIHLDPNSWLVEKKPKKQFETEANTLQETGIIKQAGENLDDKYLEMEIIFAPGASPQITVDGKTYLIVSDSIRYAIIEN